MADSEQKALKGKDPASWSTVRRFLPYLWPKERPELRWRIAGPGSFDDGQALTYVCEPRRQM